MNNPASPKPPSARRPKRRPPRLAARRPEAAQRPQPAERPRPAPAGEQILRTRAEAGERATTLVRRLTALPHTVVRGLFEFGCVLRAGIPCTEPGTLLDAGEMVEVRYEPGRRYRSKPRPRASGAFLLVYEDAYLVVADKAPGVLTVPNHGESDTLQDAVRTYLGRGRRQPPRVFIVHRLDRETSGLLVLARTPEVAQALKAQFAERKPERLYQALLAGPVREERGTFRSHLATDPALNQHSTSVPDAGKLAVTHYRVTHRLQGATAVEVRLETGRRNQIRVHFAEAGHPVLGDPRYASELAHHPRWKERRMALHAAELGLVHPITGAALHFTSPMPEPFVRFLAEAAAGPPASRSKAR